MATLASVEDEDELVEGDASGDGREAAREALVYPPEREGPPGRGGPERVVGRRGGARRREAQNLALEASMRALSRGLEQSER